MPHWIADAFLTRGNPHPWALQSCASKFMRRWDLPCAIANTNCTYDHNMFRSYSRRRWPCILVGCPREHPGQLCKRVSQEERFGFFASPAYLSINRHRHRFARRADSRLGAEDIRLFFKIHQIHDVAVEPSRFLRLALNESLHIELANLTSPVLSLRNQYSQSRGTKEPLISAIAEPPRGNVRGTRERDPSFLRLDGPRRCSVTKGPQELISPSVLPPRPDPP